MSILNWEHLHFCCSCAYALWQSAHDNSYYLELNCDNGYIVMNGNHHIQQTRIIWHNQQMTQYKVYMIVHKAQSIAIKQHDDVCSKGPYLADH